MSLAGIEDARLVPHHGLPSPRGVHVVTVALGPASDGGLLLAYRLRTDEGALAWPGDAATRAAGAQRRDGLWQRTCCELFIRSDDGGSAYREFNFSPCGDWAAYDFEDYRVQGALPDVPAPSMRASAGADGYALEVHLPAGCLPPRAVTVGWRLGLAAVLEVVSDAVSEVGEGALSWWALRHPGARPDFHHRDGFVLSIDGSLDPYLEVS